MIKTLMATVVAITGFANVATADVSHCGINESRMNPTALSDYQECWLDVYSMDKDYGVLGSLFWVRANGEYYSTQLSNLRTEAQRSAWLGSIQADATATFETVVEVAEGIDEVAVLRAELVIMTEERDELIMSLADANADIAAKAIRITELNGTIADHTMTIGNLTAEVEDLKAALPTDSQIIVEAIAHNTALSKQKRYFQVLEALGLDEDATFNQVKKEINNYKRIRNRYIEIRDILGLDSSNTYPEMVAKIKSLQAQVAAFNIDVAMTPTEGSDVNNMLVDWYDGEGDLDLSALNTYAGDSKMVTFTVDGEVQTFVKTVYGWKLGGGWASQSAPTLSQIDSINNELNADEKIAGGYLILTAGGFADVVNDMKAAIEEALDKAYDKGYEDGYKQGYANGYRDGVNDTLGN